MEILLRKKAFFLAAFLLLVLVGCNSSADSTDTDHYNFPDYVLNASHPAALEAYQYAVDVEDEILEYIPCYCNCVIEPHEHNNVRDCFIDPEMSTDDLVVYDDHGTT